MSTPEAVTRAKSFMSCKYPVLRHEGIYGTGLEEPATHSVLRHVGSGDTGYRVRAGSWG